MTIIIRLHKSENDDQGKGYKESPRDRDLFCFLSFSVNQTSRRKINRCIYGKNFTLPIIYYFQSSVHNLPLK